MIFSASSVAASASNPAAWITIFTAGIATFGAVFASIVAARSAKSIKKSELRAQHTTELENRISQKKYEIYEPIIEMFGEALSGKPQPELESKILKTIHEFFVWISIYGSDDAIIAFRNFQQAAYSDVPPEISIRLYSEFILAARRDIARSDTKLKPADIIGIKVSDVYSSPEYHDVMAMPFARLCRKYKWKAPWLLKQCRPCKN